MKLKAEIEKNIKDKKSRVFMMAIVSLAINFLYGIYNGVLGIVCLSIKFELGKSYNMIIMITIATYTFPKVITAIVNSIKVRKNSTPIIKTIRNINVSNAVVSMFSLELSMYATFDKGGDTSHIYIMEIITGIAMCICVLTIGILMIYKSKREISDV